MKLIFNFSFLVVILNSLESCEEKKSIISDLLNMIDTTLELLNAFEHNNLAKFVEFLEVYEADPNSIVEINKMSVFEVILSTPKSSMFIKICIDYGADFYMVNFLFLLEIS